MQTHPRLGYPSKLLASLKRPIKFRLWDDWDRRYHALSSYALLNQDGKPQYSFEGEALGMVCTGFEFDSHLVLEQFTGLLDSKGVEIYEGDIVSQRFEVLDKESRYAVTWDAEFASFRPFASHTYWSNFESAWDDKRVSASDVTVIGNIHQHAHLLSTSST